MASNSSSRVHAECQKQKPYGSWPSRPDFAAVNTAAISVLLALLQRWLPDGHRAANEWVARNPRRADRTSGSFKINLRTGRWADFATGDKGGDVISLAAYLFGLSQLESAQRIASMLGVNPKEAHRG
jgi:hypothetical protein